MVLHQTYNAERNKEGSRLYQVQFYGNQPEQQHSRWEHDSKERRLGTVPFMIDDGAAKEDPSPANLRFTTCFL